jgi:hypothetical protein
LPILGSPRGSLNFGVFRLRKKPIFEAGAREAGAREASAREASAREAGGRFFEASAREAGGRFFEAGAREDVRRKRLFFEKRSLENTVLVKW